jgi:mRNA interferase MazF
MNRGEVRAYRFAAPDKRRPVVVVTRQSALRFLQRVTVAPITTNIRDIPTEVLLGPEDGMRELCVINVDNLQTVSRDGLGPVVATIGGAKLKAVEDAIAFALGFDTTQ